MPRPEAAQCTLETTSHGPVAGAIERDGKWAWSEKQGPANEETCKHPKACKLSCRSQGASGAQLWLLAVGPVTGRFFFLQQSSGSTGEAHTGALLITHFCHTQGLAQSVSST